MTFANLALALLAMLGLPQAPSQHVTEPRGELIFPLEGRHNHGSCLVELPDGSLLACWYNGSGERTADDVRILGARLSRGTSQWSRPIQLADNPGFPDCNPCMGFAPDGRLWLFWPVILDNHWESALLQARVAQGWTAKGMPRWREDRTLLLKPGPEFTEAVEKDLDAVWAPAGAAAPPELKRKLNDYLARWHAAARDKLKVRLGWMPRVHPFTDGGRMILPLYSDGFDFSLMAITDDNGRTWSTSRPIIGPGNVQPSIVKRRDGTLVAYFRDNGPPPQRALVSESRDRGMSWSVPRDTELRNPGSGLEAISLRSGRWIMVYNDTEEGRHSLAVSVSEDEGRTWATTRHLERDSPGSAAGSYSYPSVIQARNGVIHVTYSYSAGGRSGESIKHVRFAESWLLAERRR